jgi:hypothetical protein
MKRANGRDPLAHSARAYSADKARQRDIILKSPAQRVIFVAGLAAAIAVAVAVAFLRF